MIGNYTLSIMNWVLALYAGCHSFIKAQLLFTLFAMFFFYLGNKEEKGSNKK